VRRFGYVAMDSPLVNELLALTVCPVPNGVDAAYSLMPVVVSTKRLPEPSIVNR
jgi:hypothetical protein